MKNKFSSLDETYMCLALQLAKLGGRTSPNPQVGAVVVQNGKVISTGFHRGPGSDHAELVALKKVKTIRNVALYITLEPCCHTQKLTPPCVDAILASSIRRVIIGTKDPNPLVNGKGIRKLKQNGIQVEWGCLQKECDELIYFYKKWVQTKNPYVILKSAISLDGKIAMANGDSHWITAEESRKKVHHLRSFVDAVLIGSQTALKDNPQLTVRLVKGKHPLRIVLDSNLKLPLSLKLFQTAKKIPTAIAVLSNEKDNPKISQLKEKGVFIYFCKSDSNNKIRLSDFFSQLGGRGILSVMVEGGATLASSILENKLFDELLFFIAPKILGYQAINVFKDFNIDRLKKAPRFQLKEIEKIGEDFLVRLI